MAFTETPKEKEKRLAYYAKNKSDADAKEAARAKTYAGQQEQEFRDTVKPDTGETTNPMGDKYRKGGAVKCRDGIAQKGKTKGRMV